MKELIKELVTNLLNPQVREKRRFDLKQELQIKFDKSLHVKEHLKSWAWLEFQRPIVYNSLESGIGRLLRDGLTMNEIEIKALIADMRANVNYVIEMKNTIDLGEDAGAKLERLSKE